jgi:hypothetical protein
VATAAKADVSTALMATTQKQVILIERTSKNKLISLLLLFRLVGGAQSSFDWFPIRPGIQYNFRTDTSIAAISNVIKTDSASANNTTFFLNKIVTYCDTCVNAQLLNDLFDSTYSLNRQPQFLGHFFKKTNATTIYFKGKKSYVFRFNVPQGSTWLFDSLQNIQASLVSKTVQPVFGNTDSVYVIKLSTNDTILLSKSLGVFRFPFNTTAAHRYNLVGVEGAVNKGVRLKRFHDFFNFSVGDVLQYELLNDDFNFLPPMLSQGHERWDFLSVTSFPDSVRCIIRKSHYDSLKYGGSIPVITVYTQTQTITFIDSTRHLANLYPMQEISVSPYFLFNNGLRYIHHVVVDKYYNRESKSFGETCPNLFLSAGNLGAAEQSSITSVFLNRNSSKVVGRSLAEGLGFTTELYNDNSRMLRKCLIGFKKGTDSSGTIYHYPGPVTTGVISGNSSYSDNYFVYPSLANQVLYIAGSANSFTQVEILNLLGEKQGSYNFTPYDLLRAIDVSAFPTGLYFLKINGQPGQKVLITH